MKGLTILQPWASLIALRAKTIETRNWRTEYRGPIVIHAGLSKKHIALLCGDPHIRAALGGKNPYTLPLGAVVAVATLKFCYPTDELELRGGWYYADGSAWPLTEQERALGDFRPGRYAWLLGDIRRLNKPIPYRGAQGLWKVSGDVVEAYSVEPPIQENPALWE